MIRVEATDVTAAVGTGMAVVVVVAVAVVVDVVAAVVVVVVTGAGTGVATGVGGVSGRVVAMACRRLWALPKISLSTGLSSC